MAWRFTKIKEILSRNTQVVIWSDSHMAQGNDIYILWTADLSKKRSLNEGMTASYPGVSLLIEMQKNEGPEQEAEEMTFQRS